MTKVSKRQEAILQFIKEQVRLKGYPPSVREIGEAVGLASSSTVHGHLSRLEGKGLIRRDPTKPRAIEIITPAEDNAIPRQDVIHVPLIGKVTAGNPITAIENIEEFLYDITISDEWLTDYDMTLTIDGVDVKECNFAYFDGNSYAYELEGGRIYHFVFAEIE